MQKVEDPECPEYTLECLLLPRRPEETKEVWGERKDACVRAFKAGYDFDWDAGKSLESPRILNLYKTHAGWFHVKGGVILSWEVLEESHDSLINRRTINFGGSKRFPLAMSPPKPLIITFQSCDLVSQARLQRFSGYRDLVLKIIPEELRRNLYEIKSDKKFWKNIEIGALADQSIPRYYELLESGEVVCRTLGKPAPPGSACRLCRRAALMYVEDTCFQCAGMNMDDYDGLREVYQGLSIKLHSEIPYITNTFCISRSGNVGFSEKPVVINNLRRFRYTGTLPMEMRDANEGRQRFLNILQTLRNCNQYYLEGNIYVDRDVAYSFSIPALLRLQKDPPKSVFVKRYVIISLE